MGVPQAAHRAVSAAKQPAAAQGAPDLYRQTAVEATELASHNERTDGIEDAW